jgi:hypothetical protein
VLSADLAVPRVGDELPVNHSSRRTHSMTTADQLYGR